MAQEGRAYTEEDLKNLPKIREDGSVDSPDVISMEDAEKIAGGDVNPKSIELEEETDAPKGKVKKEESEEEGDEKPKKAEGGEEEEDPKKIELDEEEAAKKMITVGGVTKSEEEWLEEMAEHAKINLEGVPDETKETLLQMFIDHKHKEAWQKSNTTKAEENARTRRELDAERRQIESRKTQLKSREQTLLRQQEALKALASKEISEDDLYDDEGKLNLMKQRELHKVLDAREKLPEIEQELKQNQQEMAQADIDRTLAEVEALIAIHPEYNFEGSQTLREAMQKHEKGILDGEDEERIMDLYEVIDYARDYGVSIDTAFNRLAKRNQLTVTATKPNTLQPTKSKTGAEKMAAQVSRKQAGTKFLNPDGSSSTRSDLTGKKVSMGDKLREASARATGASKNSALEKAGY